MCAITSGSTLRKQPTFVWTSTVSVVAMCCSIGMAILNLIPGVLDKIVKVFPKGVFIEVIIKIYNIHYFIITK